MRAKATRLTSNGFSTTVSARAPEQNSLVEIEDHILNNDGKIHKYQVKENGRSRWRPGEAVRLAHPKEIEEYHLGAFPRVNGSYWSPRATSSVSTQEVERQVNAEEDPSDPSNPSNPSNPSKAVYKRNHQERSLSSSSSDVKPPRKRNNRNQTYHDAGGSSKPTYFKTGRARNQNRRSMSATHNRKLTGNGDDDFGDNLSLVGPGVPGQTPTQQLFPVVGTESKPAGRSSKLDNRDLNLQERRTTATPTTLSMSFASKQGATSVVQPQRVVSETIRFDSGSDDDDVVIIGESVVTQGTSTEPLVSNGSILEKECAKHASDARPRRVQPSEADNFKPNGRYSARKRSSNVVPMGTTRAKPGVPAKQREHEPKQEKTHGHQSHPAREVARASSYDIESVDLVEPQLAQRLLRQKYEEKLRAIAGASVTLSNKYDDSSPPMNFEFIDACIHREGVVDFAPEFRSGCQCSRIEGDQWGCQRDLCACLENMDEDPANRYFPYEGSGRRRGTLGDKHLETRNAIFECNELCGCSRRCKNRLVQHGRQVPLEIFLTRNRGWGLRCLADLRTGEFIDTYRGEIITHNEAKRRDQARRIRDIYTFALDKFHADNLDNEYAQRHKYVVDGEFYGGPTRFINHSCHPNVGQFSVSIYQHDDPSLYQLAFFAKEDIPAGTELTFDYVDRDVQETVMTTSKTRREGMTKCLCGSRNCRGYLWL